MQSWRSALVECSGPAARRALVGEVVPAFAADPVVRRWFFADLRGGPDGLVEVAVDLPASTGLEALEEGLSSVRDAVRALRTHPAVLSPSLFAGRPPPPPYVEVHVIGTRRAAARLDETDATGEDVSAELGALVEALAGRAELSAALSWAVGWLSRFADPVATASALAGHEHQNVPTGGSGRGTPTYTRVGARFRATTATWPRETCYGLIARLAHTQALRLAPQLSFAQEVELLRAVRRNADGVVATFDADGGSVRRPG